MQQRLDEIYRQDAARIRATLVRLIGDFELADEALQDAFTVALERWPIEGEPRAPRAWLVSTARHKALDVLRGRRRAARGQDALAREIAERALLQFEPPLDDSHLPDDRLRLIFTCCHPALAEEARIALTLRTLCGLTTEEIARAFLVATSTMAQRLVRAQRKISDARIPYRVPAADELGERLDPVLRVVYLVFTEGYSATAGDRLHRPDLAAEAIRLGRMLVALMPDRSETRGLLALMLLHHARREARVGADGDLIMLEDQDRACWDRKAIDEGLALAQDALANRESPVPGPYAVQAAIAALHAEASQAADTDWRQIEALYGVLLRIQPTPVVELNRAVAVAMAEGPEHGLRIIEGLERRGELRGYHLLAGSKAALLVKLGRTDEAAAAYEDALGLVQNEAERRFLSRRLDELRRSSHDS
jgi:RNA polymerase sigma-70 factor (ECF subfamily)